MNYVAGVGKANFDILYSQISRLPREGEEVYSRGFQIQLGGGAPATLINLQRLGVKVKLATFLGNDIFSGFVKEELDKNGVEYRNLYRGDGIPLSVTSAMITEHDRTFVSYSDKIRMTEELKEEIYSHLHGAKIVEMCPGYLDVYRRLKAEGTRLILDVGWDDQLSIEKYKEYLELADYFTPNQKEAMKMTRTTSVKDAARCLADYFKEVIIKMDREGCLYMKDHRMTVIPPLPGIKAVDSTGAGDAFLSGFIYGIFYGYSTVESIRFGNVTGGTCVQGIGCLSKYVTEDELIRKAQTIHIT